MKHQNWADWKLHENDHLCRLGNQALLFWINEERRETGSWQIIISDPKCFWAGGFYISTVFAVRWRQRMLLRWQAPATGAINQQLLSAAPSCRSRGGLVRAAVGEAAVGCGDRKARPRGWGEEKAGDGSVHLHKAVWVQRKSFNFNCTCFLAPFSLRCYFSLMPCEVYNPR